MSLELPPDEMRRLGYRVIDAIVDHWSTLGEQRTGAVGDADALRASLGGPPPDSPTDASAALERLLDDVVPWAARHHHPRFFARVGSPSNYVSALADAVAAGFNLIGTSWVAASGPSTVELTVLDWLRGWCGMPPGSDGLLTSGGSSASLTALVAAREAFGGGGVVYLSDQAHGSILRDLREAGIVDSLRGADGGYWLAKPAAEISVADVIRAVDGPLAWVRGIRPEDLEYAGPARALQDVWIAARASLREVLEAVTLADVAAGRLPASVRALTAEPSAWEPH